MPILGIDELSPSHDALDEAFRQEALFCSKLTERQPRIGKSVEEAIRSNAT